MSLKAELKALQTRLETSRPADVVATMHRAVEELRASGATRRQRERLSESCGNTPPEASSRTV